MKQQKNSQLAWLETVCLVLAIAGVILVGQSVLEVNHSRAVGYSIEDISKRFTLDKVQDEDELYENLKLPMTQIFVGNAQKLYPGVSADVALQRALGRTSGAINDLNFSPDLQTLTNKMGSEQQSILVAEDEGQKRLVEQITTQLTDEVASDKVTKKQSINKLKDQIMKQGTEVSKLLDSVSGFLPSLIPAGG